MTREHWKHGAVMLSMLVANFATLIAFIFGLVMGFKWLKYLMCLCCAITLTACDAFHKSWEEGEQKLSFVETVKVGDTWNRHSWAQLMESNDIWDNYCIETVREYCYITVKNGRVVSLWFKQKPY